MKKLLVLLVFAFTVFALSSCSDDGIVVKLHYLSAKGKYETVKIKKFESGEKLSDRIDSTKTDFYKEKDKEKYDEATADVILESDYKMGETVVFETGDRLSFTGWSTKAQGETGSIAWDEAIALTDDVEVYAQYTKVESVSLLMSVAGEPIEGGDPKFETGKEAFATDRNISSTFTVTLVNATLKEALTAEQVVELVSVSVTEDTGYEFTIAPTITGTAVVDATQISFNVNFTGEAAPSASAEDLVKSGVVKFEIPSSALTVAEGYYAPEKVSTSLKYEITYEKKAYVSAGFTTAEDEPSELTSATNSGNTETDTVVVSQDENGSKLFKFRIKVTGATFLSTISEESYNSFVTAADEAVTVSAEPAGADLILVDVNVPKPAEIGVEGVTVTGTLEFSVSKENLTAAAGYEINGDSITASLPYSITFIAD